MLDHRSESPPAAPLAPAVPSVEAERLDAIGGVAAGVAHHLNNILMVVLGNIQLSLMQGAEDGPAAKRLHIAERAVRDAADVLKSLTAFCRTQPMPAMEALDLNVLIDQVVEMTASRWRDDARARGAEIALCFERADLVPVLASMPALRQALANLFVNAVEAMPKGGTLTIQTWIDDGTVHCRVSDTGIGMSAEVRRRALEPFQTTKGPKTRGLGLAVAHGTISRHGGRLSIDSLEGHGTSVLVSLPAAGARPLV